MLKTEHFFALLALCFVSCDAHEITCPESTRPHKTECNKYFKCIKLPSNSLSWVTLTCQEGLIYDKNLRSCAMPADNWDCNLSGEESDDEQSQNDENNVYGVQNLNSVQSEEENDVVKEESDEFLEIVDGDKDFEFSNEKSRKNDNESSGEETTDYSGDGNDENFVTPSSPTVRMVTTQVQRLTQLIQNLPKTNNDITPDDLNTYLATQKIQLKSPDYQKINFHSDDKTTVPADGKVHPDIESEIINRQNDLNLRLTTLAMDDTTPASVKPVFYINKEPVTEIKLKSGDGLDGFGSHQIVVNRPEGSVLFNVPGPSNEKNNKQNSPFLSEDILKTILEISKQMVTQKTSNNAENNQPAHPIYYAVPIPIVPPQNHIQNYYGQYSNQSVSSTESALVVTQQLPKKRKKINKNRINPYPQKNSGYNSMNNLKPQESFDDVPQSSSQYPTANNLKTQPESYQNYQYPANYYSPYTNNYPQSYNQQPYNSMPYYQQYSGNDRYNSQNNFNQFSNYNGAYYGNRPFVSDSSAPFVDHSYAVQQKPFRKESFSSYENDDDEYDDAFREESDDDNENLDELSDVGDEEEEQKGPTDGLICTFALARQANKTDCFKYYVCNAKTKEVLSYTCPAFTAFNDVTKYCDSGMYKSCKKSQDSMTGNLKNNKMYAEAQKALQQAKRESQKVERIANLVKKQSQRIINNRRNQAAAVNRNDEYEDEPFFEPQPQIQQRPIVLPQKSKVTYKTRPKIIKKAPSPIYKKNSTRKKKKKVRCIAPGNVADPEDRYSYWHCFKSPDGRMKRIHKKCSSNLRFCAQTTFCSSRC